ncbi:MAG: hypothetical protein KF708_22890 [Pirellulales bacterium]|nr:hypothetical protein [Pirellulales bacterium]
MKPKQLLHYIWHDERGVLSFEWILLVTVVVIGIVGGVSSVRDALISELGDIAGGLVAIDQSYSIAPDPFFQSGGFSFDDTECNSSDTFRPTTPIVQQDFNP